MSVAERRALLSNSRKTECGAKQFLISLAVRAAPFALLSKATPSSPDMKAIGPLP